MATAAAYDRVVTVPTVRLADLADGAARLVLGPSGQAVDPLVVVDLDGADWSAVPRVLGALLDRPSPVLVGVASRPLPAEAAAVVERLACTLAPSGPGRGWVAPEDDDLERIGRTVAGAPLAAVTLVGLLGLTSRSSVPDGLVAESLAYSTLLAGPEFAAWRSRTPRRPVPPARDPVRLERVGDRLVITLDRPERRNAYGVAVRDALLAGLEVAELDASVAEVVVRGAGPAFCSGGDLDEFGTAPDVAAAHLVRLCGAGLAIHRLGPRIRFEVHGECIGAGIELPAFAGRVDAHGGAHFRLPELSMGLVPGAGGTVSITRRIGRWRTAYLALTGRSIDVEVALGWGLVDGRA